MKFAEYLQNEDYAFGTNIGKFYVEVWSNPTSYDLSDMLKNHTITNGVRWAIIEDVDRRKCKLYVWDANLATHFQIATEINKRPVGMVVCGYGDISSKDRIKGRDIEVGGSYERKALNLFSEYREFFSNYRLLVSDIKDRIVVQT